MSACKCLATNMAWMPSFNSFQRRVFFLNFIREGFKNKIIGKFNKALTPPPPLLENKKKKTELAILIILISLVEVN